MYNNILVPKKTKMPSWDLRFNNVMEIKWIKYKKYGAEYTLTAVSWNYLESAMSAKERIDVVVDKWMDAVIHEMWTLEYIIAYMLTTLQLTYLNPATDVWLPMELVKSKARGWRGVMEIIRAEDESKKRWLS